MLGICRSPPCGARTDRKLLMGGAHIIEGMPPGIETNGRKRFLDSSGQGALTLSLAAALLVAVTACSGNRGSVAPTASDGLADRARATGRRHFDPPQVLPPAPDERANLGGALFYESAISVDGRVSCVNCHRPVDWGADAVAVPTGVLGRVHRRNSPTVLNASMQFVQNWHGDRESVEEQAVHSLLGPVGGGNSTFDEPMKRLEQRGYAARFRRAFPKEANALSARNFGVAIGAFERLLVTTARFDDFLRGRDSAMSAEEQRGLLTFVEVGCSNCHDGTNLGGTQYSRFGIQESYWKLTGSRHIDGGRFEETKREADRYVFKVPMLRNIDKTGPYFHDGSVAELRAAIRIMGQTQLGVDLDKARLDDIEAFLRTLTGKVPAIFVPPSTTKN
jgi:cytochrome c peroxidase